MTLFVYLLIYSYLFTKVVARCRSGDVERVFGEETLKHAINIARGHVDFLLRLPRQVLVKIIGYLPLEDIIELSCVSKQFHEVNTEATTSLL